MSKRILYIGGFELPDKNAAAQRVIANAKLLSEMGFEISFIGVSKDITNSPRVVEGFESNPIPYPSGIRQWIHQIVTFVESKDILKYRSDYVIMYNFPSIASLKILKACHKQGIKVLQDITEWEVADGWTPRTIVRRLDINLRMRYCMKRMDGVIAISRYLYGYYKPYTNTILVPPTVDLQSEKWCRSRELKTGERIELVYAGSAGFGVKDRLDVIINAMKGYDRLHLTVIGMTRQQYVQGYRQDLPEDVNVDFKGRLPHCGAVKNVQNADFQMLIRESNLKNNAGFPTKFVESMSCCTPVIATLTSNISDFLRDGENGFVVSADKPLSALFAEIVNLPKERIVTMKRACKDFTSFDYRGYKSEFEKLFKQMANI